MVSNTQTTDLEERLARLVAFLADQAESLRSSAPEEHGFIRGHERGIAQGYELAAKWIADALAGGFS